MQLLYVEDNRINAILFEEALRLRGNITLQLAQDGQEALDTVRNWRPDVIVLDAHLPDMNGYEVLEHLRALPGLADVPAFMCSADARPEEIAKAQTAGFTGYWTKPINLADILADLQKIEDSLCDTATPRR